MSLSPTSSAAIPQYLDKQRLQVDAELERILPGAGEYPPSIHQAMRHSVFAGGKRLRPILCLESGRLFNGDERSLRRLGCALELIHTYSLIHDDLPALDNDDLRRGKPSCHRVFGEATAILAGDALLTLAFEIISEPGAGIEERRLEVIHDLSHAIGTRAGMVGGQVVDLETAGHTTSAETLDYIHSAKTGSFIRAAVRSGALDAGANPEDLGRLSAYGGRIGLAFQIADDLLDVTSTREELGKSVGKDDQQHKATYPAIHGIEESRRIAVQLVHEACQALEPYGDRARRLQELAHFLIERTH
ncbi:MAG: polyprenyl synthetase family protein [Acidobacteriia bacterium]|nr:polyprenyl synthetase family protein [Terriglobia bacterium]